MWVTGLSVGKEHQFSCEFLAREAVLRHKANSQTLEETHVIKNEGIQDMYFTEEHWSSEIKSFVTTTPPKFAQVSV